MVPTEDRPKNASGDRQRDEQYRAERPDLNNAPIANRITAKSPFATCSARRARRTTDREQAKPICHQQLPRRRLLTGNRTAIGGSKRGERSLRDVVVVGLPLRQEQIRIHKRDIVRECS
jgi:hypothetical protein